MHAPGDAARMNERRTGADALQGLATDLHPQQTHPADVVFASALP